jgi:hypothetical protein
MPSKAHRTLLTNKKKKEFLELIRSGSSVTSAAQKVGISRRYAYDLREADQAFASEWDEAWEDARDLEKEKLEKEADRRAMGYQRELSFKGRKTDDSVTEYSDNLIMFRLKRLDPAYKDSHKVEVNVGTDRLDEVAAASMGNALEPDTDDVPEKGSSAE